MASGSGQAPSRRMRAAAAAAGGERRDEYRHTIEIHHVGQLVRVKTSSGTLPFESRLVVGMGCRHGGGTLVGWWAAGG